MRAWFTHFILPEEPVESGQTGRQPALFVSHFVPNLYPSFGEQRESNSRNRPKSLILLEFIPKGMARVTGLEPATSGVTGRHSNRLSYTRAFPVPHCGEPPLYARALGGSSGEVQAESAISIFQPPFIRHNKYQDR